MRKIIGTIGLMIALSYQGLQLAAQPVSADSTHQVAIFVPLYLDSAFDNAYNFRFDKNFPKFLNPGLEFYEGAQLALDSLKAEGIRLDIHVYDTRSSKKSIAQILQDPGFEKTELIIGHVSNTDLRQLAEAARRRNIPFINVNFPNDGGVSNNPDFILLNSTLKTHCEGLYKFMQRNYATSNITVLRKKGALEDRIKAYFGDVEKNTASVPLHTTNVNLDLPITLKQLEPYLDSTRQNVFLVGSLDENFAKNLCLVLAEVDKTYRITVVGMPTWDNIADFSEPDYNGMEIVYSTPFYINPTDNLVKSIQQYFRDKLFCRPSDMVFRGYETTFHFASLLCQYGPGLAGNIGEKKYKVFNDFDIEPVYLNKQNTRPDYLENKKLYFIKKTDGNITAVF